MLAAAVFPTGMAMTVPVPLLVMAARCIGIKVKVPLQQGLHRLIRVPRYTAVNLNGSRIQRTAGSASNSTADQGIYLLVPQKSGQSTVTAAVGIHYSAGSYLTLFYFIDFKVFRMAKMLKYLAIFIGDCDFHGFPSCWLLSFCCAALGILWAACTAAGRFCSVTKPVVSPLNPQRQALHQHVRNLFTGVGIDLLH